ncbi:hypothetical protein GCM10010967_22750 [Dyadobacter beijingensis]|uniref:Membrane-bound lysozyme-inhibitor of c-type lysozyme n=1 Tax=Dyadobacter beijingensis TaxID=365489 RepID=A0ABQ2HRD8_9BACT|nr:hypothetical protein [Dyadobacter beijingensis]GGM89403.1 hypothetical protein GCM10010967_22750 [Dyadobacter beijingensis]
MNRLLLAFAGVATLSCGRAKSTSTTVLSPDCGKWVVTVTNGDAPQNVQFIADSIESYQEDKVVLFAAGKRAIWSGDEVTLARYQCP